MHPVSLPCKGHTGTPWGLCSAIRIKQFTKSGTRSPRISVYIGCNQRYVFYNTFSLWDTYRSVHPMYTLILGGPVPDFVNCLIRIAGHSPQGVTVWPLQR